MLIGLCGKPRVGKTEVTKVFDTMFNYSIIDTKHPLRTMAAAATGIGEHMFANPRYKNLDYKGYELRQIMGELGLKLEEMFGADYLLQLALDGAAVGGNYILDALRQNQPKSFPGKIIEVVSDLRGVDTGNDYDLYDRSRIDAVIINNGKPEDLFEQIKKILVDFKNG